MASGKNKQYGLILAPKVKAAQTPTASKKNVFGDDSESDSDDAGDWVKKSLKREALKSVEKRATKVQMKQALKEDPTVFQYDEIYDDLEQKKVEANVAKKGIEKKPRYIQHLLQTAERRKKENERRVERQVQKEREEEGSQFADKESFVTSSYRQKLEEFKKQEEEEKRMERLEAIGDVTRQKDLTGFYRHLYRQTMGESLPGLDAIKTEKDENSEKLDNPKFQDDSVQSEENKSSPTNVARKRDRHYRKRRSSSSSSSKSDEHSKTSSAKKDENVDADSDFTGSSHSSSDSESSVTGSGSEEGEIIKKRKVSDKAVEEGKVPKKKAKHEKKKNSNSTDKPSIEKEEVDIKPILNEEKLSEQNGSGNKSPVKDCDSTVDIKKEITSENDSSNIEVKENVKPKINVWEKRTVGQAFDDAVQRYYERKAARAALRVGRG